LPLFTLLYTLSALHPLRTCTFCQALQLRLFKKLLYYLHTVRFRTSLVITPTKKEVRRFVMIPPSNIPDVYTGVCIDEEIKPADICEYWYPERFVEEKDAEEEVDLNFHGGAFTSGS
ncbi:hypothetical protein BJ878DRAFT_422274, partial [Calycina marina]